MTKKQLLEKAMEEERSARDLLEYTESGEIDVKCAGFPRWIPWAAYLQAGFGVTVSNRKDNK